MYFAGGVDKLAVAGRRMVAHVAGLDFVILGDVLGALLAGACSVTLEELQPSMQLPLLLQRAELAEALRDNAVVEGRQEC